MKRASRRRTCSARLPEDAAIDPAALHALGDATIVDLSLSPNYRKGHVPGAWFAIRARLAQAIEKISPRGTLVFTSEDGVLAGLAVEEVRALTHSRCAGSKAATPPGLPPVSRCRPTPKLADEPLDAWLKPYERAGDPKAAMNEYLSWEVDLLERIKRDGTTHFTAA